MSRQLIPVIRKVFSSRKEKKLTPSLRSMRGQLHFGDRRDAAQFRYRNRAESTILKHEQRSQRYGFRADARAIQHSVNVTLLDIKPFQASFSNKCTFWDSISAQVKCSRCTVLRKGKLINMYYKIPCNSRVHRLPVYVLDQNKDTVRKEARRPVS